MEPYAWLPATDVGAIVSVERADDLSLTAAAIDIAVGLAGLPGEAFDVTYDVETWRIRYTTQDRGQLTEATMLLSFPVAAGDVPTFVWLHGTTGFSDACAPSALGLEGGGFNLLFASQGYVVVSPDYLGMNGFGPPSEQVHPYLIPEAAALATMDAVRAAWAFTPDEDPGSAPTRDVVWFGASEGGFTAMWTDRYQPHYLPEAQPIGVVASVPPTDLPAIADVALADLEESTMGLLGGVVTWHDWYRVPQPLEDILQPALAAEVSVALEETCAVSLTDVDQVDDIFTAPFVEALGSTDGGAFPELHCALYKGRVATSDVPHETDTPVLYVVAELDELVTAGPTRDAFGDLCDVGYRMTYLECAGATHVDGAVWSLPETLQWTRDRVEGVPLDAPCEQGPPVSCSLEAFEDERASLR